MVDPDKLPETAEGQALSLVTYTEKGHQSWSHVFVRRESDVKRPQNGHHHQVPIPAQTYSNWYSNMSHVGIQR